MFGLGLRWGLVGQRGHSATWALRCVGGNCLRFAMPPTSLRDWCLSAASLVRWLTGSETERRIMKESKVQQKASLAYGSIGLGGTREYGGQGGASGTLSTFQYFFSWGGPVERWGTRGWLACGVPPNEDHWEDPWGSLENLWGGLGVAV